jgi:hypothetical protein
MDGEDASVAHESLELLRGPASHHRSSPALASIEETTSRLCDLAADRLGDPARNGFRDGDPDDGGWDWLVAPTSTEHSSEASPENLYGAVALAPWAALRLGLSPARQGETLYNAFLGAALNPNVDSPPDFVFLTLLSDVFPVAPAKLARQRYDAKVAAAGGAAALAESIRAAHEAAASDGLFAYDLAWLALGAAALDVKFPRADYRADFRAYVQAVVDDVGSTTPLFDITDAHEPFYTQGLSWSLLVLSWTPGAHTAFDDVRSRLLATQLPSGAFPYNLDFPAGHLQTTAHALTALALVRRHRVAPHEVSENAANWLISQQAENGGFVYTADQEYPLLDAEIALGLYLSETRSGERGLQPRGPAHAFFALTSEPSQQGAPPLSAPLAAP